MLQNFSVTDNMYVLFQKRHRADDATNNRIVSGMLSDYDFRHFFFLCA